MSFPFSRCSTDQVSRGPAVRFGVALALCAALAACGDDGGFFINVGVQNSTGGPIQVTVSTTSGSETISVSGGGYQSTEVEGTSGDVVQFNATTSIGTISGTCTATNDIVGTSQYGQANIYEELPSGVLRFECSSGWLEAP